MKRGLECGGPKELTWIDQSKTFGDVSSTVSRGAVTVPLCPVELSLAAFEQDICLAYARKNLLRGGPVEIAYRMVENYEITTSSANTGLSLLRKALLSLAVTFYGRQHGQRGLERKGYHQYGQVLRQLNTHLAHPDLQKTDETLLTALSCMLLEVFIPTGPANFLKHQRGLDALAMLRGPPTESDGPTATIFRGLRILSIVGSLAESRPSLYAQKDWKQVSFVQASEAGLLQYRIFTILADCTRLISIRNALQSVPAPRTDFKSLLIEVEATINELEALFPLWTTLNMHQLAEVIQQSDPAKSLGVANHVSATAFMLYNTAYICVTQIKDSIAPSPTNVALRNDAAIKITKCLEIKQHEQSEGAPLSNTIAFVAIKVAGQALGGFDSPEGRRLAHAINTSTNAVFRNPSGISGETLFAHFLDRVPVSK